MCHAPSAFVGKKSNLLFSDAYSRILCAIPFFFSVVDFYIFGFFFFAFMC